MTIHNIANLRVTNIPRIVFSRIETMGTNIIVIGFPDNPVFIFIQKLSVQILALMLNREFFKNVFGKMPGLELVNLLLIECLLHGVSLFVQTRFQTVSEFGWHPTKETLRGLRLFFLSYEDAEVFAARRREMKTGFLVVLAAAFLIVFFVTGSRFRAFFTDRQMEGFQTQGDRCGVDLPPCAYGLQCFNGFCASATPPVLPAFSPLAVEPSNPMDAGSFLHTE